MMTLGTTCRIRVVCMAVGTFAIPTKIRKHTIVQTVQMAVPFEGEPLFFAGFEGRPQDWLSISQGAVPIAG